MRSNYTMQRTFVWFGPAMMVIMGTGFILARILPPPSPSLPTSEVMATFADNQTVIGIGLVMSMLGVALYVPFGAMIAYQVRRMTVDPIAAWVQLVLALSFAFAIFLPMLVLMAADFRSDRDPAGFSAIYDIGWFLLVAPVSVSVLEMILLGWSILADKTARPVFPRWVGYYCVFEGISFLGGAVIVFFKTGPFAWSGIFPFWIPFGTFGGFFCIMTYFMLKSISRDEQAEQQLVGDHESLVTTAG